ncbi:hypothetical protein SAMN05192533_105182 [Mesobacillus persicus]|uniref:Uncharacterized protein n=1 Tax=Mesobacillus persicus TaxID=930146 RepID=A0A1H8AW53_9BACI|nr:hypothetical protein [Mesobacillus persicus]SEM74940.1 hypothetical protein SAMN05192533_105182 [Mesobacillus persicus]
MVIKKLFLCISMLLLTSFISTSLAAEALIFEKLPQAQKSKQWAVHVGEAEKEKDLVKPIKGKFVTYSLKIDKIGNDVDSVKVHLYRNEPNSKTKYSLVSCPNSVPCSRENDEWAIALAKQMNDGKPYLFRNFLLAEKATELEVEVVWTEGGQGRSLKETFTFTEESKE